MPDILHRVGIDASPAKVFSALTTIDGLRHWWVGETKWNTGLGELIDFGFCQMKVIESTADSLVHWTCTSGPDEWVNTGVFFRLEWKEGQTFILFTHSGWKEPVEFMHHCSTKWATFLLSLRDWLESGSGKATPNDIKIHVGD
ncbi:MAG: SRPBCC domain-containing protein [Geothrix sp.]|uniref:SRPBCC family protein n=1 Tax=Geothrix sp. TaxID=1962974 RepID=UPI0017B056DA|nr:SRPBCC domain-containing protein [Geothrix sp.]NWJ42586.1 SRPBCC domain-containing protein [Geothrix sp.]WIL19454.1 MAG: SRPBCC domain-containing protein [Geothrix sp.]